jgi:hypothetical protein
MIPHRRYFRPASPARLGLELPPLTALAEGLAKLFPAAGGCPEPNQLAQPSRPQVNPKGPGGCRQRTGPQREVAIDIRNLAHTYMKGTPWLIPRWRM